MCMNFNIKPKLSSNYNPQSNSILERKYQTLGNALQTFELEKQDLDEANPFEPFMSAVTYALHMIVHTTLQASPG